MMIHTEISPAEQADRLAIRELVDAYAHCADRRPAEGQKALFTEDTHFVVPTLTDGLAEPNVRASNRVRASPRRGRSGCQEDVGRVRIASR
jgi:hypothetical protein